VELPISIRFHSNAWLFMLMGNLLKELFKNPKRETFFKVAVKAIIKEGT